MTERNAQRSTTDSQALASYAHDLANALTGILGHAQLALATSQDPMTHRSLVAIEHAAQDAAELLRRMRSLHEVGPRPCHEQVSVNGIAEHAIQLGLAQVQIGPIEVQRSFGTPPDVMADATALRGAIANIVINAVEAMPAGGRLTVTTGCTDRTVFVEVADTGKGIAESDVHRVLDPCFSTKASRGRGLGLSSARSALLAHRGDLQLWSKVGRGTTVRVCLPSVAPDAHPDAQCRRLSTGASVLVIEDDQLPLAAVIQMLRFEGHRVSVCRTFTEGLAELSAHCHDIVITGLGTPASSGNALADLKDACPATRIIALAGRDQALAKLLAEQQRADLVVPPPVFPVELRAAVSQALSFGPQ